ncbi:MAG: FG-GAP repeat protein [Acidimicrobiales bacterium]
MTRRLAVVVAVGAMLAALSPLVAAVPAAAAPAVRFRNSMLWETGTNDPWIGTVSVGDLNGDGRDDVAVAMNYRNDDVRIYYQDEHGLLDEPVIVQPGIAVVRRGRRDRRRSRRRRDGVSAPSTSGRRPRWFLAANGHLDASSVVSSAAVLQLDADPTASYIAARRRVSLARRHRI